jgi:nucleoside-diphosphate-sugar epimerase
MKRVLVTGASGFVGANLTRRLLRDGHEVHLFLRNPSNQWRLADVAGDVQVHQTDIEDRSKVRLLVAEIRPEWVFHLAAYGAYAVQSDGDRMVSTNLGGCLALLDACIEAGVAAFVQTGSSAEYGYLDHTACENELIQPNSTYAVTKAAATHYCQWKARESGLHAVTARLYSIYGPYEETSRLIPVLVVNALHGRLPRLVSPRVGRDFVYVDDAIEALLSIAGASHLPRGSVYNVSSGVQSTLAAAVAEVQALLNITVEPQWSSMQERSWDTETWVGSPAAIARDLHWQAHTGFRSGLERTVSWLRNNPAYMRLYTERIMNER